MPTNRFTNVSLAFVFCTKILRDCFFNRHNLNVTASVFATVLSEPHNNKVHRFYFDANALHSLQLHLLTVFSTISIESYLKFVKRYVAAGNQGRRNFLLSKKLSNAAAFALWS